MKISIPKPCHENWDAMLPEEQGRFCLKCTKTVVDFSARSMEEIKDFFREASGKVCGRFSAEQLHHEPQPVLMPVAKARIGRFAWALYLVFGSLLFSCADQSHTTGEVKEIHVKGHVEKQQSPAAEIKTQDSLTPKQRKEIYDDTRSSETDTGGW